MNAVYPATNPAFRAVVKTAFQSVVNKSKFGAPSVADRAFQTANKPAAITALTKLLPTSPILTFHKSDIILFLGDDLYKSFIGVSIVKPTAKAHAFAYPKERGLA